MAAAATVKEAPKAGGDPGASMMVKRRLNSQIASPKCARVPGNTRSALMKYVPRPLTAGKKAASLDDLTRDYEDLPIRRLRTVGGSSQARGVQRLLVGSAAAPAAPSATGVFAAAPTAATNTSAAANGATNTGCATAGSALLKRRVTHRRSLEGRSVAVTEFTTGTTPSAPAAALQAPSSPPPPSPSPALDAKQGMEDTRTGSAGALGMDSTEEGDNDGAIALSTTVDAVEDGMRKQTVNTLEDDVASYRYCDSETGTEDLEDEEQRILRAASKVFNVLLLNAWRRRRVASRALEGSLAHAREHAAGLALQVRVLRQLLDAERARTALVSEEQRAAHARADRLQRLLDAHVKDRVDLENQLTTLKDSVSELKTKCCNAQNDFLTARNDAKTYEEQLHLEREKLTQLRLEKQALLDKVHLLESKLTKKTNAMEDLTKEVEALKPLVAKRVELEKDLEDAEKSRKELEEELKLAKTESQKAQKSEASVLARLLVLEEQLSSQTMCRQLLEARVHEQQLEITMLQLQVRKNSWRQRCLRVARVLMHLPFNVMDMLQPYPYVSSSRPI